MKVLMLIGGAAGFAIGLGFGWVGRSSASDMFWHACLALYAGGLLMRWWGRLWLMGLREALQQRAAAAAAAAAAAEQSNNPLPSSR